MQKRNIVFKPNSYISPCPKCGNSTNFTITSDYCAEDCCEVWATCECGFNHDNSERFEDVWGGCGDANVRIAISCWNDAIRNVIT